MQTDNFVNGLNVIIYSNFYEWLVLITKFLKLTTNVNIQNAIVVYVRHRVMVNGHT